VSTVVICLGNELIGDDGVGIRVGRVLQALPLPSGVEVMIRPNLGLELLELMAEHERLILVDAMTTGRTAGACAVIDVDAAVGMANCPSCAHSIGIAEVLQLAKKLRPSQPRGAVRIVGVEGEVMDQFGIGLSAPVRRGMLEAVDLVLQDVGAGPELRELGRVAAHAEAAAELSVRDVLAAG